MSTLFWLASMLATNQQEHPVFLRTAPVAGGIEVRVVGRASEPLSARYRLEVSSRGSGNRSSQGGLVRLRPNEEHVLITLTMSAGDGADWSARLFVEPDGRTPYEEVSHARAAENP